MPSLDDILAKGSASFRRLNRGLAAPVSSRRPAAARVLAPVVAPALPQPIPEQNLGVTLERHAPAPPAGPAKPARRPHVHFYLHRVQLLDGDNKYASIKPLLDALRHASLIANDRERDIDLAVTQEKVGHYSGEGTGIVITYP